MASIAVPFRPTVTFSDRASKIMVSRFPQQGWLHLGRSFSQQRERALAWVLGRLAVVHLLSLLAQDHLQHVLPFPHLHCAVWGRSRIIDGLDHGDIVRGRRAALRLPHPDGA